MPRTGKLLQGDTPRDQAAESALDHHSHDVDAFVMPSNIVPAQTASLGIRSLKAAFCANLGAKKQTREQELAT